jgi:hypothetical protein
VLALPAALCIRAGRDGFLLEPPAFLVLLSLGVSILWLTITGTGVVLAALLAGAGAVLDGGARVVGPRTRLKLLFGSARRTDVS